MWHFNFVFCVDDMRNTVGCRDAVEKHPEKPVLLAQSAL